MKLISSLLIMLCAAVGVIGQIQPGEEKWGYVPVREGANMFWWFYGTTAENTAPKDAPTILWLQGGPGASSTGFGNFVELGPLDEQLQKRNTTWQQIANIIFVDNPVGTGYSYVDDKSKLVTNGKEVAADLITLLQHVYDAYPDLQGPLFVFCESFGGWMTANLVHSLLFDPAGQKLQERVQIGGAAIGDGWVEPIAYVDQWAPYLKSLSLLSDHSFAEVQAVVSRCDDAVKNKDWQNATNLWGDVENIISQKTDDVNWYNVLEHHPSGDLSSFSSPLERAKHRILSPYQDDPLSDLMNGPIRKKLGIIPSNVTWGGQAGDVFDAMNIAFMQPMYDLVDDVLKNGSIPLTIYNGQLDLICCTPGTVEWMNKLQWSGMTDFNAAPLQPQVPPTGPAAGTQHTQAFLQHAKGSILSMFRVMMAGHMAPAQNPDMALYMAHQILKGIN